MSNSTNVSDGDVTHSQSLVLFETFFSFSLFNHT